jgi:transcriptional regulator with XRE-family HTH domain
MGERILILIKAIGVTQKRFAETAGISQSGLTELIKGRTSSLSSESIASIYRSFNVNPQWLLTGDGEMFLSQPKNQSGITIHGRVDGKNVTIGNNNTVHNYPVTDDEQEIIDSLRQKKNRDKLKIIKDILKLGVFVCAIGLGWWWV